MRAGEKRQVVIPKHVRERAGIREGTEVAVELKGGAVTACAHSGSPRPVPRPTGRWSGRPRLVRESHFESRRV
ncbi:MAG: AbrB/MazE/SpoVT family DNA-binding domain-containing protein [Nitrososphaerota archaeon]|nr:AbrB/MazE/SpoVT family DNA-binding domain-containing protein [Nitrososphaerota archaeon]